MRGQEGIDLSIIIVNWNTRNLLAQCLTTVAQESSALEEIRLETLVVDNASTDHSAEMVRDAFPWVRLLVNDENVGFARANNQALRLAEGRFILLLNPDTELHPQSLEQMLHFMLDNPDIGGVGPRLLNPDGSLQPSCFLTPTLWREFGSLFHLDALWPTFKYSMDTWSTTQAREVEVIKGACLLIRREAFEQVGLLDERFFMYAEEVDLCLRLLQHGWKLYWLPKAEVIHYGGQSTKQVAASMFLYLYRTKVLYYRKHKGSLGSWSYKTILLVATLVRLSLTPLIWFEKQPQRQEHLRLARHYRTLLTQLPAF